jgi:hypothetical protein
MGYTTYVNVVRAAGDDHQLRSIALVKVSADGELGAWRVLSTWQGQNPNVISAVARGPDVVVGWLGGDAGQLLHLIRVARP